MLYKSFIDIYELFNSLVFKFLIKVNNFIPLLILILFRIDVIIEFIALSLRLYLFDFLLLI